MKKQDLTKNSTIEMLILYLDTVIKDKCPREKLDDFDLGLLAGQLKLLDMIKGIK